MVDIETFVTTLYVMVDDFVKEQLPKERVHPGRQASLDRSEVITLAIIAGWHVFCSEQKFYDFASLNLGWAFPRLPDRSQYNRLARQHAVGTVLFGLYLADLIDGQSTLYQALDGMGVPVRNLKRRGDGWLFGRVDIGWSNRLGWYEGFNVLVANTAKGAITGFGFAPASTNDRQTAETLFAARHTPQPRLVSVGQRATQPYLVDKGFGGRKWEQRWRESYGAETICPPQRNSSHPWPKEWRRWHAGLRQIAETVHNSLLFVFRLDHERPHTLDGFFARLAGTVTLHNFCMWLNQQLGRPLLAFAGLVNLNS